MTYQTTNPKACYQPLRSIPLIRPVSCLGPAFLAQHDPQALVRQQAVRKLDLARLEIGDAWLAYGDAKAAVGAANKMRRKDRHDRAIFSDCAVARRVSAAFGTMNRRRARFLAAHKALAAAEAAVAALAN